MLLSFSWCRNAKTNVYAEILVPVYQSIRHHIQVNNADSGPMLTELYSTASTFMRLTITELLSLPHTSWGGGTCSPPFHPVPQSEIFKNRDFVDAMISKLLHDLRFTLNQPLVAVNDQCSGILQNKQSYEYVQIYLRTNTYFFTLCFQTYGAPSK